MVRPAPLITPVLLAGSLLVLVGFAIRASFGVFQLPIATEFNWPRAEFSLAIAIQNLAWGFGQPLFGAVAEKIGDRKAIVIGALAYALGLVLSAGATLPIQHQLYEVLVGLGVAGTGFGVVLAVVGRASSAENRSMSLAIVTAAGSAGQVLGPPLAEGLLAFMPWQSVFVTFAALILAVLVVLPWMRTPAPASRAELQESMGTVVLNALRDPSFAMIFMGFFSCGYQLAFITAHFPAFVAESCGPIMLGSVLHAGGRLGRQALHQKVPPRGDLHGTHADRRLVHPYADDAHDGARLLRPDGIPLACYRAAHLGLGRASLWAALHGHALRHRVPEPPAGEFRGRLAGWAALRHLWQL
jgi:MFS family permease